MTTAKTITIAAMRIEYAEIASSMWLINGTPKGIFTFNLLSSHTLHVFLVTWRTVTHHTYEDGLLTHTAIAYR